MGIGAMFKSHTKPDAKIVSINKLKTILNNIDLPIVLIEGINKNTITKFKNLNIFGYAMISPIIAQSDISKAARELKRIINTNNKILIM